MEAIIARLIDDAGVGALVEDKIYTDVPQDTQLPYIKVRSDAGEFDTKETNGFDALITIDIWTDAELDGTKEVNDIADAVMASMQNVPYVGLSVKSLCLQFQKYNSFKEPDDISFHGIMTFKHLYSN